MFTEFFCGGPKCAAVAWGGMAIVVSYSFFVAHVKARLNDFYETFYDLLGEGGATPSDLAEMASGDVAGSGEALSDGGNGGKKMAREEPRRSEGAVARAQCVVRTARASCASAIALRES